MGFTTSRALFTLICLFHRLDRAMVTMHRGLATSALPPTPWTRQDGPMKKRPAASPRQPPPEYRQDLFRIIDAADYPRFGIDPQDVPIGTFAAEDHPNFLASRSGGNAYGLGLIEQNKLTRADFDFIQQLDFQDQSELAVNSRRINQIYQQLGLLIRFSTSGRRYFLIPINLLTHSLQDVTSKADEIEQLVLQHLLETGSERLDIGLMASSHDLLVHELRARLSIHRIFLFESMDKVRSWRTLLDLVILPRNPAEYLLEQPLHGSGKRISRQRQLFDFGAYLAGKVCDILEPQGKWVILAHATVPTGPQSFQVTFHNDLELKNFLIFTHVFKTREKYSSRGRRMTIEARDLFSYFNRYAAVEPHLNRLLQGRKPEDFSLETIEKLPYLNLRLPNQALLNPESQWQKIFATCFETLQLVRKCSKHRSDYWQPRLSLDQPFPEDLILYSGRPRRPQVTLKDLEQQLRSSGLLGCPLALVAEYRNSFRYVLDVLHTLARIRDQTFTQASLLEADRLRRPFRSRRVGSNGGQNINRLVRLMAKLGRTAQVLNPDQIEGHDTPVLENLAKLSVHGFTPAQLSELVLIIAGHSTMSRVVFGKLPAASLKSVTALAGLRDLDEVIEILRFCRLMSIAESAAALGELFTREHLRELFDLYRDAVQVASSPDMDWDTLKDIRISELGGVQNTAVREMMKFFNLFEFLNSWKEFEQKGRFEKEVFCDYDPLRLERLQDALNLVAVAKQFKAEFIGDRISSQSYFFRQFLETEFHGTGHLFPVLGTSAGFVLLWIAVNAAEKRIINFNPMLARFPADRQGPRIAKIRAALMQISHQRLQPRLFESLRKTLAGGRPAFVLDSGVRLIANADTKAIDVSFVDVDENIGQILALLDQFEAGKLRDIGLKQLQDLERLFSELESYRYSLRHHDPDEFAGTGGDPHAESDKIGKIEGIETKLRAILYSQIFVPEEIFDTISVLAAHCSEVLRFILPEFHAFGNLVENWPTRKKQSLGTYVMRSLQKFQALITRDRDAFQDRETFYQLAKREFGALAEEDIGAKHAQLASLEDLVDHIQQTPALYHAFTLALLLQDIGKVDKFGRDRKPSAVCLTHAEEGASILEETGILGNYTGDEPVKKLALSLIRHHGILGHVIQGEEPITALEVICRDRDPSLVDAFVLHSVLAAAAVEEGLMIEDLLERFLQWRHEALRIIEANGDWASWLDHRMTAKTREVFSDPESMPTEFKEFWLQEDSPETALAADQASAQQPLPGIRMVAFERLLRLLDVRWVDILDLQMYLSKVPINYIYHKKLLKSVGLKQFQSQLQRATRILQHLSTLDHTSRDRLFRFLDPVTGGCRIYDFHPLNRFLEIEECVKMLLIALDAFAHLCPHGSAGGLVSFRPISQEIDRRYGALRSLLRETHLTDRDSPDGLTPTVRHWGGLQFQVHEPGCALRIGFQDAPQLDHMLRSLGSFQSFEAISRHYQNLLQELKKLPYDTVDYELRLRQAYARQCGEINDRVLRQVQQRLKDCRTFADLNEIRGLMESTLAKGGLQGEQEFLMREIFDYHRQRLLTQYLEAIQKTIGQLASKTDLIAYWDQLKLDMMAQRDLVGKEYESMIATLVDKLLAIDDSTFSLRSA